MPKRPSISVKAKTRFVTSLKKSRDILFKRRAKRPRPHLDDKIITAWNGLMISAFARGAQVLGDPDYLDSAERALEFLRANLYDESTKTLRRNFREGKGTVAGFAEDYAFVIQALLDLYEADFDIGWLQFALELQETQDKIFFDEKKGGYFSTSGEDKSVLLRMKEDNDGAEPSSNSIAALNLLRFAQLRGMKSYRERAEQTIRAFAPILTRAPIALPQMLVALDHSLGKPRQIVIAGERAKPIRKSCWMKCVVITFRRRRFSSPIRVKVSSISQKSWRQFVR